MSVTSLAFSMTVLNVAGEEWRERAGTTSERVVRATVVRYMFRIVYV